MNISRSEDQFKSIVSYSSPAFGANLYVKKNNPKDHIWNNSDFIAGDINTSIIKTNLGKF